MIAMSTIVSYCEWCGEDQPAGHRGVVPVGRWVAVLRDCPGCLHREATQGNPDTVPDEDVLADAVVANILCTNHVLEVITASYPSRCSDCGYPRTAMVDVVVSIAPISPFSVIPDLRRPVPPPPGFDRG